MYKLACTSGCLGQDGAYLTKFLLEKGYKVIGLHRRYSTPNYWRLEELGILNNPNLTLLEGDITDNHFMTQLIMRYKFDEFYNTAAMSHVGSSFECPDYTMNVDGTAVIGMLEAIRQYSKHTKFYQCSTSELWGNNFTEKDGKKFQNEDTPFSPTSPYSVAKMAAHHAVRLYREAYGLFAVAGILHNHDGPLRGDNFLTRKVTKWIAQFKKWKDNNELIDYNKQCGYCFDLPKDMISTIRTNPDNKPYGDKESWIFGAKFPKLKLGNLDSVRDIGSSQDYVEAMYVMLQQKSPVDYVIGTGVPTTMREFVRLAFEVIGIKDWENYVEIDKSLFRASEVNFLCADASKANIELGWRPKTTVQELAKQMVEADIRRLS